MWTVSVIVTTNGANVACIDYADLTANRHLSLEKGCQGLREAEKSSSHALSMNRSYLQQATFSSEYRIGNRHSKWIRTTPLDITIDSDCTREEHINPKLYSSIRIGCIVAI